MSVGVSLIAGWYCDFFTVSFQKDISEFQKNMSEFQKNMLALGAKYAEYVHYAELDVKYPEYVQYAELDVKYSE